MARSIEDRARRAGGRVTTVEELLGLSAAEAAVVGVRLALSDALRSRRQQLGLTQRELAERIGSSQSRVAKMEVGDSVSIDQLIKALLAMEVSLAQIGRLIGRASA